MSNNAAALLSAVRRDAVVRHEGGVGVVMSERLLAEPGLRHGFTTRLGGVSEAPFDSLNLGTNRPEPYENILENYRRLCVNYGLRLERLAIVRHEHGVNILKLGPEDAGRGVTREPFGFCDGLVTDSPLVTLVTAHADCSAFFVYDRRTRSIGLAHAGWKGMFGRIGQKLVERLSAEYGADPNDMVCAIGPCICENCFEVDLPLAESFAREFDCPDIYSLREGRPGKAYVALRAAGLIQLLDAGVPFDSISVMDRCTFEEPELFFSYRRDGKGTGAMAGFMTLD